MKLDYTKLRPTELVRLLNATVSPTGKPLQVRALRKHQNEGGIYIGEEGRIHLSKYAAWLRARWKGGRDQQPAGGVSDDKQREDYEVIKERAAARRKEASRAGRDIGPIKPVAEPERRKACESSLRFFCETYNPDLFYWGWSEDHLTVIEAIEQTIVQKATLAFAMPRGSGKSSLCRMAVLWAASYAHAIYPFLLGANEAAALVSLETVKKWMRELHPYVDDFPEISQAAQYIGGSPILANNMLCDGEPTYGAWEAKRIVLPRVPPPPNWTIDGKYARTSNIVIGVSGLTGNGIRGSLFPHPSGKLVRPDFVLLDDPQTDESAASPKQNNDNERLINGAVLGMAGPGKPLAAVLIGTVIRPDDMMARLLDRKRSPFWRGIKKKLLRSMPANMAAWESYFDVYRECMGRLVPDLEPANRYYLEHRDILDAGAEAAWEDRKDPGETSAIQSAMNIYCRRGREVFFAEYQNEPLADDEGEAIQLTPAEVAGKLNKVPRRVVPKPCNQVTAFCDVHDRVLYWVVCAWEDDFTGYVIDYGTWPKQPTTYFAQATAPRSLADLTPGAGKEAAMLAGFEETANRLLTAEWKREDGAIMKIGRLLFDSKYETELVKSFCRRSAHAGLIFPSQGFYLRPDADWRSYFSRKTGGQTGYYWRIPPPEGGQRYVLIDADWYKTMATERLRIALGDRGCWSLFGNDPNVHALFADHCCAEAMEKRTALNGGWKWHFELRPGRPDNHWWDGLVGCAAAASMLGVAVPGVRTAARKPRMTAAQMAQMARRRT